MKSAKSMTTMAFLVMINAAFFIFCDRWAMAASASTMSNLTTVSPLSVMSSEKASLPASERYCFVCYSCARVETSQSLLCPDDMDMCMVCKKIIRQMGAYMIIFSSFLGIFLNLQQ